METLCVMTSGLIKCHISAFVAHKDTKTRTAPQIGGGWRRKNREKKPRRYREIYLGSLKSFARQRLIRILGQTAKQRHQIIRRLCVWAGVLGADGEMSGAVYVERPSVFPAILRAPPPAHCHRRHCRPRSRSLISYRLCLLTLPGRFVILSRRHSVIFQGTAINQLTGSAISQ